MRMIRALASEYPMEMVLFPKQYKCMWDEKCDEAARGEFPWLSKKGWLKKLL